MIEPQPGAYEGHACGAEPAYSCGGEVLVEVDCWFTLPDAPEAADPALEAERG